MKRNEWYLRHTNCPKCGSKNVVLTTKEVITADENNFSDDVNTAVCGHCDWKGMVKNLVPDKSFNENAEELQVQLRTVDKVNEIGKEDVFIAAEDMVAMIRQFGSKLIESLNNNEEVITYTENLLAEIIKMIISADISHRKQKLEKIKAEAEKAEKEETESEKK